MRNRSYIGDGVYASIDANGDLRLECGGATEDRNLVILNKNNFHSLMEFVHKKGALFHPSSQLVEIPSAIFSDVVKGLRELEPVATPRGTKLQ